MLTDFYGNHLTTSTGLARDSYDIGLACLFKCKLWCSGGFSQAVEADPNFSLAYLGVARAFMSSGEID